jgi:hypothetical protein
MFGYDNVKKVSVCIGDPGADKNITLLRCPADGIEITGIYVSDGVGVVGTAGTGFALTVYNGGTSGTAQTVVGSALGGTSTTWTALLPKAMSLGDGTMTEGQYLWAAYDETGAVAQFITIMLEYRNGIAA